MKVLKMLAMIFLAVFLILTGIAQIGQLSLSEMAKTAINGFAIVAGILIFISLGRFTPNHK